MAECLSEICQHPKGYILYDSTYITLSKWKNLGDSKQISGCQKLKKGRVVKVAIET